RLCGGKQGRDGSWREIGERFDVFLGNEQAVSGEQRPVIKECERMLILNHDRGGGFFGGKLAKQAFGGHPVFIAPSTSRAIPRSLRGAEKGRSAVPNGAADSGWASGAGRFRYRYHSTCRGDRG